MARTRWGGGKDVCCISVSGVRAKEDSTNTSFESFCNDRCLFLRNHEEKKIHKKSMITLKHVSPVAVMSDMTCLHTRISRWVRLHCLPNAGIKNDTIFTETAVTFTPKASAFRLCDCSI